MGMMLRAMLRRGLSARALRMPNGLGRALRRRVRAPRPSARTAGGRGWVNVAWV